MSLGRDTPCVPYALPTTLSLARKTAGVIKERSDWTKGSLILANHGAICTGTSMNEAVNQAMELESKADELIKRAASGGEHGDWVNVYRKALEWRDLEEKTVIYFRHIEVKEIPRVIKSAFSRNKKLNVIIWSRSAYTRAFSEKALALRPLLDDMAQLIGINTRCYDLAAEQSVRFRGKNALFIKGEGALCAGRTLADAQAVQMVLEKSARSHIESAVLGKGYVLTLAERLIMRLIYLTKYSRINDKNRDKSLNGL